MATIRPMKAVDLLKFNPTNLDHLTETYSISFYLEYLAKWPHLCRVIEGWDGGIEGYTTNPNPNYLPWHAHITALTVAPSARRLGHATLVTSALEAAGDASDAWFVDLFVREENKVAQTLYEKMGYSVYRRVVGYYNDDSDAFDMRKPLKRDGERKTVREGGENVRVDPSVVW
ncbi:hypothetical protein LTR04_007048 [Oleoguttula sp. CCFEE 6159]|nr:hypothetical protein LTR04_007048 [Oleoguttula sp. CCFEE 6159]